MSLTKQLSEYARIINPVLATHARFIAKKLSSLRILDDLFYDHLIKYLSSGKKIRGSIFLHTYKLLGGDDELVDIAVAIELLHSGLLIQDDWMDQDSFRRDMSSIHYFIRNNYSDDEHFADSMAVLVSDYLFFYCIRLLSVASNNNSKNLDSIKIVSDSILDCCLGQSLDILFSKNNNLSEQEIIEYYKLKTSSYTFVMPLLLSACFANSNKEVVNSLEQIGLQIGVIYQLRDEFIGFFSRDKIIGKPVGSDIKDNKKTLLRELFFKECTDEYFLNLFGDDRASDSELSSLRKKALSLELDKKFIGFVNEKVKESKKTIHNSLLSDELKKFLEDLIVFCASRTK